MAQKVRSTFAVRKHATAFKSTVSSVVSGMAALRIKKDAHPIVLSEKALGKQPVRQEVIEISDDEDLPPAINFSYDAFPPHHMFEQYIDDTDAIDFDNMMNAPPRPFKRQRSDQFDFRSVDQPPPLIDLTGFSDDHRQASETNPTNLSLLLDAVNQSHGIGCVEQRPRGENITHDVLATRHKSGSSAGSYHTASGEASSKMEKKLQTDTSGTAKEKEDICPYYLDPLFGVPMYRGPGYESFPIALGSVEAHQAICDEWNERERLRLATNSTSAQANIALQDIDEQPPSGTESALLQEIQQVLPDIEEKFAIRMIRTQVPLIDNHENISGISNPVTAEHVLAAIVEQADYPRQKLAQAEVSNDESADGTGKTIQFVKGDAKDTAYRHDCVSLLAELFKYVPTHAIDTIMKLKGSIYEGYKFIEESEQKYHVVTSKPYRRKRTPRSALENKYKTKSERASTNIHWRAIVNELQAARQSVARDEVSLARSQEQQSLEAINLMLHKESNDIVTCQCCFDDEIPLNRAITCNGEEVHWFCFSCVKSLAESQLGIMRYELVCMDSSGCQAAISRENISQAVPTKVLDKLDFFQQQSEIMAADIDGLEQCPHCEFKAICDKEDTSHTFYCANPDCGRASCLHCHEKAHSSQTCEQAKMEKGLTVRHLIEEARSEAMVRTCPRCKVKIVKDTGCNKIKCTQCSCPICFVCRKDLSGEKEGGYGHFQRSGAKCQLHDAANFDRHAFDATEAEKKAIELVRAGNSEIDEKVLQIETGQSKGGTKSTPVMRVDKEEARRRLEMIQGLLAQRQMPIPQDRRRDAMRQLFEQRMDAIRQGMQPFGRGPIVAPGIQPPAQRHNLLFPERHQTPPPVRLRQTLRDQAPMRK